MYTGPYYDTTMYLVTHILASLEFFLSIGRRNYVL